MYLKTLEAHQFKNYKHLQLSLSSDINHFSGENGAGKTNILDAIYYLTTGKSYFNNIDQQNILHEENFLNLKGIFSIQDYDETITCDYAIGKRKTIKKNAIKYDKLSQHIGFIPVVMLCPADALIIEGHSDTRRSFIDQTISQTEPAYLETLIAYSKVLTQRNSLLKRFKERGYVNTDELASWDKPLTDLGKIIFQERSKYITALSPLFEKHYRIISGNKEAVSLAYNSQLSEQTYQEGLKANLEKDKILQRTSFGVHKDDLTFLIDEFPIKKFGSQGQQKSFLMALKFAQFETIHQQTGKKPLLLLDDIFDKLDAKRVTHIFKLISDSTLFGQTFITDTDPSRTDKLFAQLYDKAKRYGVKDGCVREMA